MLRRSERLKKPAPLTGDNDIVKPGSSSNSGGDRTPTRVENEKVTERPEKRQKKPTKAKKTKEQLGDETRARGLLENLPVELLFEILTYLQPYDMVMLARTNHAFRNHLTSRNAQLLWERARGAVGAPAPPPNCPEPRWANLLFGGTKCQLCGKGSALRIEFGICRRLCAKCRENRLVSKGEFAKHYPEYDVKILELLSYTIITVGEWGSGITKLRVYWDEDIPAMHEKLKVFDKGIASQQPEAKARLAEFKKERKELVATTQEVVKAAKAWVQGCAVQRKNEKIDREARRKEEVIQAFIEMGYPEDDVKRAMNRQVFTANDKAMSSAAWTKAKKKYEPIIIGIIDRRLLPARVIALKPVITEWVKAMPPEQWPRHPPVLILPCLPIIKAAFQTNGQAIEDPAPEHCAQLADKFPEISAYWEQEMSSLFDKIFKEAYRNHPGKGARVRKELAVVRCGIEYNVHIGSDEWVAHPWACNRGFDVFTKQCTSNRLAYHRVCVDQTNYLYSLISLLGQDLETVTPRELDSIDARFFCNTCDRGEYKSVYTWRQFLAHTCGYTTHLACLVTKPELLQTIRDQENSLERSPRPPDAWLCMHCPAFPQPSDPLLDTKQHLAKDHGIAQPVEWQDYMWNYGEHRSKIVNPVIIQPEPSDYVFPNAHDLESMDQFAANIS